MYLVLQKYTFTYLTDYKLNVLMKLHQVLANQTEMLALMRKLTVASGAASEDVEDILPRPLQTAEELEESSRRLEEDGLLRKKTVIYMYNTYLYRYTLSGVFM